MISINHENSNCSAIRVYNWNMTTLAAYFHNLCNEKMPSAALDQFNQYQDELLKWNSHFNLTAIRTPEEIESKHFMDSLSLLPTLQKYQVKSLIDVGTGAGFPGIPLKIVDPTLKLVLVESVEKKAKFCQHIIQTLDLKDASVMAERVEAIGQNKDYREQFDCADSIIVARNGIGDLIRIAVGVDDSDGGNFELVCLSDCDGFLLCIDNKYRPRQPLHFLQTDRKSVV